MAKYKVGDKVRVRYDLQKINPRTNDENWYMDDNRTRNVVVKEMVDMAGKTVTIKNYFGQYHINECGFAWTDEMFEELNKNDVKYKV